MVTTKIDVNLQVVIPESEVKPEFNAPSFGALIDKINADPTLLNTDWRDIVRDQFRLSAEQSRSLVDVSQGRVEEIQSYLIKVAEFIKSGGSITGRILRRPLDEQTPEAVHEVRIEPQLPSASFQKLSVPQMFRIAHCDANCRHWKWDSW